MGKQLLVSVIMGVYNKAPYVREAIESVLAQTYPNFELIIVDDASTDGSTEIIYQIQDPRIRYLRLEKNSGTCGVPRNHALCMAKGEYISFLDADDLWAPRKLEQQVQFMQTHHEYPFTHTACTEIDEMGQDIRVRHGGNFPPHGDYTRPLLKHCFISISSVMMHSSIYQKVGMFSEDKNMWGAEDYDYFLRCAIIIQMAGLVEVLTKYRNVGGTYSHKDSYWRSQPRDFPRHTIFLGRPELWYGKVSRREVRQIAYEAADENAYFWRNRRSWKRVTWFAWQMIKLFPFKHGGRKQFIAAVFHRH